MVLTDLLQFDNPAVVAIALGVLAFLVVFSALSKMFALGRGPSVLIAFCIGAIVTSELYSDPDNLGFVLGQNALAVILFVVVAFFVFLIGRTFFKYGRHQFRR